MRGFKKFRRAKVTISGIELLHRIRKSQITSENAKTYQNRDCALVGAVYILKIPISYDIMKIRLSLATAVFLAGSTAAFAQTSSAPSSATMNAVTTHTMTRAQIAIAHRQLPKSFATAAAAVASCKTPVIWANPKSKVYYPQTSAGFGTARPGVYACVRDAIKAGFKKTAV